MEFASLERELHINASPEIVYDVISSPEHITEWWPDEADFSGVIGEGGTITFHQDGGAHQVALTVVATDPPRSFAFRWTQDGGAEPVTGNSLLVTFVLVPSGSGTVVTMTETGFREMGWEAARLATEYADHVAGWDYFLPRLGDYASRLASSS